jgi:hypothetical protein
VYSIGRVPAFGPEDQLSGSPKSFNSNRFDAKYSLASESGIKRQGINNEKLK